MGHTPKNRLFKFFYPISKFKKNLYERIKSDSRPTVLELYGMNGATPASSTNPLLYPRSDFEISFCFIDCFWKYLPVVLQLDFKYLYGFRVIRDQRGHTPKIDFWIFWQISNLKKNQLLMRCPFLSDIELFTSLKIYIYLNIKW